MGRQTTDRIRDTYFSLWSLTEAGVRDPGALKTTIDTASTMIRDAQSECQLYVAVGGAFDLIGVARGENLSDTRIVEIQHAIRSFGTLRTDFIKAREFSLNDFATFTNNISRLRQLKP